MVKFTKPFKPSWFVVVAILILSLGIASCEDGKEDASQSTIPKDLEIIGTNEPQLEPTNEYKYKNEPRILKNVLQLNQLIKEYENKNEPHIPNQEDFVEERYYETHLNRGRHFKFWEIRSHSTNPTYNWVLFNINEQLEQVRAKLRHRMVVNSGYRNPVHNRRVGGVIGSQHIYGNAVDIKVEDFDGNGAVNERDKNRLVSIARRAGASFIKKYSTHVHIDWR